MNFRIIFLLMVVAIAAVPPAIAETASDPMTAAGALYSNSVDLANAGNYQAALSDADQALAMNVSSLVPIIQANRAGILVMLGRYEEANAAADVAIGAEGNLTATKSIAWFNKGNALKELGRVDEARSAYAQAAALDPALIAPALPAGTATAAISVPATVASQVNATVSPSPSAADTLPVNPTATKAPLSLLVTIGAAMIALAGSRYGQR